MGRRDRNKQSNFLLQGGILAVASVISKVIGLIYRIPLTNIIGDKGNNYYSGAFDFYSIILLISSYTLPIAVSKLVSARVAIGERKNAYRIFKGAMIFAVAAGIIAALITYIGASAFTGFVLNTPESAFALKVLAPTLFIVAVMGVIKGYFQGIGTMMPTAIAQVIEQIVNAIISIVAAFYLFSYGKKIDAVLNTDSYAAAYGAAGGTLGTGIGALAALGFLGVVFLIYRNVIKRQVRRDRYKEEEEYKDILKILLITIIPMVLSTVVYNISSLLDQGIFKNIIATQDYDKNTVDVMWGVFSGKYKTLINVPIGIASALSTAAIPSLVATVTSGDMQMARYKVDTSLRVMMIIAIPCAVGMGVLAYPILQLLYPGTAASNQMGAAIMQVGAAAIVFYSLSTMTNGVLQGIDKMRIPVRNAFISLIANIAILALLLFVFDLNIYAVVIANTLFALLMCVLNSIAIYQHMGYRQEIVRSFLIPSIASLIMGIAVFLIYQGLMSTVKINAVAVAVSAFAGVVIYAAMQLLLKGVTRDELLRFPKGHLLVALAEKLHLL